MIILLQFILYFNNFVQILTINHLNNNQILYESSTRINIYHETKPGIFWKVFPEWYNYIRHYQISNPISAW